MKQKIVNSSYYDDKDDDIIFLQKILGINKEQITEEGITNGTSQNDEIGVDLINSIGTDSYENSPLKSQKLPPKIDIE